MGTPDFALPTLRALREAGHDIAAVYTQPPKPAGRGQSLRPTPVHKAAEDLHIPVRTPKTLRDAAEQEFFASLKLDIAIVVAYGLILPQAILDAPRLGCINIHFSLLPRWRGAMPVQHAILAGDKETGIDIMQMAAGLDTGDILMRETVPITPASTTPNILADLGARGAPLTLRTIEGLAAGTITPKKQPDDGSTYAAKLTREDGRIDWNKPAATIERQVRALQPWPGVFFMLGNEPIKVLATEIVQNESPSPLGGGLGGGVVKTASPSAPGTLLDEKSFIVACGEQALRLVTVQRAGKNPTDGASFLRGTRLTVGQVLAGSPPLAGGSMPTHRGGGVQ
jgi:methionyl-tRNA formyltransferase